MQSPVDPWKDFGVLVLDGNPLEGFELRSHVVSFKF